ncbi:osmoprotectant ABC transporter substrate-binding lipoprotein OpuCC [Lentibacillus halophilus]|uniref:Osmoprotectant ABC transporter substrate-binding lipoprotein OpuCC n=2 Tax=Lentibacillus halophilus TaxID=295065 RepID=A0ABN0Z2R3_9BACI
MKRALYKGSILLILVMVLTGCSLPGLSGTSKETINIGSLTQSESQLMAEILSIMIERQTDAQTNLVTKLGSSIVQHQGMQRGDLDITSTRYTGTDISGALDMEPIKDPEKALKTVKREFDDRFNQTWAETYGFANSYSIAVTQEFAKQNNIETISDLEPYADDMDFGVNNAWINREGDGYDGFKQTYFDFGQVFPMNLGLVYQAAASGNMDAVLAYSTDGRIKEYNLKVLKDDKRFFPPYDASPVINNETLEKYPEIREITKRLSGEISTEEMQQLNYKMDVKRMNPRKIAKQFLEKNNYFRNTGKGGE